MSIVPSELYGPWARERAPAAREQQGGRCASPAAELGAGAKQDQWRRNARAWESSHAAGRMGAPPRAESSQLVEAANQDTAESWLCATPPDWPAARSLARSLVSALRCCCCCCCATRGRTTAQVERAAGGQAVPAAARARSLPPPPPPPLSLCVRAPFVSAPELCRTDGERVALVDASGPLAGLRVRPAGRPASEQAAASASHVSGRPARSPTPPGGRARQLLRGQKWATRGRRFGGLLQLRRRRHQSTGSATKEALKWPRRQQVFAGQTIGPPASFCLLGARAARAPLRRSSGGRVEPRRVEPTPDRAAC